MSLVFAFVAVWVAVLFAWLVLDWWGNPNRGRFRPQIERPDRWVGSRRERRTLRRAREDAAVRSVLRDRFGRSSLRLQWSDNQETDAVLADEDLVTMSHSAAGLHDLATEADEEVGLPVEPADVADDAEEDDPPAAGAVLDDEAEDATAVDDEPAVEGDEVAEPEIEEEPEIEAEPEGEVEAEEDPEVADEPAPADEPERTERTLEAAELSLIGANPGWRVGDDPLAPSRTGARPPAATVRARVWKSRADNVVWDDHNVSRLRSGQPPQRRNPITGRAEFAVADTETAGAGWPNPALDPFAGDEA